MPQQQMLLVLGQLVPTVTEEMPGRQPGQQQQQQQQQQLPQQHMLAMCKAVMCPAASARLSQP